MNARITYFLWVIIGIVFTVNMTVTLVVCVLKTENHLPVDKMILLPIFFLIMLLGSYLCLYKFQNVVKIITPVAFPAFLLVYGIVLYYIAVSGRNNPVHDQAAVYQGALYFGGLSEEISWEYFARCNNNIIPAILLGFTFRVGSLNGIFDPYYFAVLLNTFQVIVVMYCLFRLLKERNGEVAAWIGIGMLSACVMIIGHTLALYTDSMSFCFGISALYLWRKDFLKYQKGKYWMKNIFIGILLGIASLIKMTVFITVIALMIYSIIRLNKEKIQKTVIVFLTCVVIIMIGNYVTKLLPCEDLRDAYGTPKLGYWVGIGLKGNGGYIDNQNYSAQLNSIYGLQEKKNGLINTYKTICMNLLIKSTF